MFWRTVCNAGVGLFILAMSVIPATNARAGVVPGPFTTGNTASNTLTLNNPGAVIGELMLAQITFRRGYQVYFITTPHGWIEADRVNSGSDVGQAIFYKTATGSETSSYSWVVNTGAANAAGSIMRFSGVESVGARTKNHGDGNTMPAPGASVSENSVIVVLFGIKNNSTVTGPGGMTEIYSNKYGDVTIYASWQTMPAGPTGDMVATAIFDNPWVANLIELKEAVGQQYTLAYAADANGSINGTTPQTVVQGGDGSTVTAVANSGYHFVKWSDESTANPRTDTNVTGNISVTANFAQDTVNYTLTYTAGANGSISGTTPQTVAQGGSGAPVTAVANTGYHFVKWSDDLTANPRTDTNVSSDISVTATFAVNTYTLTYSAGANGTISGTTSQTVNYGGSGSPVNAVANNGYHFVNWSDNSTANPRTDSNIVSDITVTANFAQDASNYTLTYTAGANGSISGTTPQTVAQGADGTPITAVPNTGYHFVNWSDSSTENPRTDTSVNSNISVTANFTINTYTLTINVSGSGSVAKNPAQATYNHGTSVQLTASPANGWNFDHWSGNLTGTTNPTTVVMNGNKTITSTFVLKNDTTAPAAITDLSAGSATATSITLNWTAPGDDANNGTAATYDVRYGTTPITEANFGSALQYTAPAPKASGNSETLVVGGLNASITYYFAIKTADEAANRSVISNVVFGATAAPVSGGGGLGGGGGVTPAGPGVTNLSIFTNADGKFNLEATAASADNTIRLTIAQGVVAKTKDGAGLKSISIAANVDAANPPSGAILVIPAYDFGPDGATFSPPINLTFSFSPNDLPAGVPAANLVIVTWEAVTKQWTEVGGTIDAVKGTVTVPVSHFSTYAVIVRMRPASWKVEALSLSATEIQPGQQLTVNTKVSNQGDLSGTTQITLRVNGQTVETNDITLGGGLGQEVTFTFTPQNPGTYALEVNGNTATLTVTDHFSTSRPAKLSVNSLNLSNAEAKIGDEVLITVTAANAGDVEGTFNINLKINGNIVDARQISLKGGQSEQLTFTTRQDSQGTYAVDVEGTKNEFIVIPGLTDNPRIINWWTIGAIICASFSVLTVAVLTMKRNGLLPGVAGSPRQTDISH